MQPLPRSRRSLLDWSCSMFSFSAVVVALALVTAGCGGSTAEGQSPRGASANLPAQQRKFCDQYNATVDGYDRTIRARDDEQNPIRKEALQQQLAGIGDKFWDAEYAVIGAAGEFQNWRGRLSFDRRTTDERGMPVSGDEVGLLSAVLGACEHRGQWDGVQLATGSVDMPPAPGKRTAMTVQTFIPLNSPLGQTLASLDVKRDSIVSGTFIWAVKGMRKPMNYVRESQHFVSGGELNSVLDYRSFSLLVRFTSIAQAR